MPHTLVLGAGPLGRATIDACKLDGHDITLATRSGTTIRGTTSIVLDITAADATNMLRTTHEYHPIDAIVVACNFPYGKWEAPWAAATTNLIAAATELDTTIVLAGNLYGYGPSTSPLSESHPLNAKFASGRTRAKVWQRMHEATQAGQIRAVEVRGSDYIGPTAGGAAHAGDRLIDPILQGKAAYPLGNPDLPHSWTAVADFGALLARATSDSRMHGAAWHVPSAPAVSIRELAEQVATIAEAPKPTLHAIPYWPMRAAAFASPMMRGLSEVGYQFTQPFVMADQHTRDELGVTHTPLIDTLTATVAARRAQLQAQQ